MSPSNRRPGRLDVLAASPLVATIGVVVASLAMAGTPSRIAVPLLGVVGILLTVAIAQLQRDRDAGQFLLQVMLLTVGVRFLLFALIHESVGPIGFAPDQLSYQQYGDALVRNWRGLGPVPPKLASTLQVGYPVMNAALYFVFGRARAAPDVVNLFLGTWMAVPVYYLALLVVRENRGVARWATVLTLFFPSLMLWSILNVRDVPALLAVMLCVFFFVRFQRRGDVWDVVGAACALVVIALFREYMTVLVGLSAGAGILMGRSRSPVRSLGLGVAIMGGVVLVAHQAGFGGALIQEPSLQLVQSLRHDMTYQAGSAFGRGANVSTVGGAIAFFPVGLTYFLLAPFPWAIRSVLQAVTLPEMIVWYLIIPFGIRGLYLALRHDPRAYTVPISVFVVVAFSYAMVEGNVGTAYRHRAQVLPLAFLFCALGLQDAWAVHSQRRAAREELRRRSGPGLAVGRPAARGPLDDKGS